MFNKYFLLIIVLIEVIVCDDYLPFNKNSKFNSKFNSRRLSPVNARTPRVRSKFEEHEVVPDVIDVPPQDRIQIYYQSGANVNFGNELTPFSVKDQPYVSWPIERGQYYTLSMVDPDVPNRKEPTMAQVNHWLVINIPGTDLSKGQTLASYRGSAPPQGSGLHRYTFMIYKQQGYITHSETYRIPLDPGNRKDRVKFNIRNFARKYKLGQPVAGNFYLAQNDEYTRQLWAKWNQKRE